MVVTPIKTNLIKKGDDLFEIISKNVKNLPERSVLAIAAKIVSICQGRLIEKKSAKNLEKSDLIKKEADYYIDPAKLNCERGIICTIKNHILGINAGVNECNADGGYILSPQNVEDMANVIWRFLKRHYAVKKVGVIITDSNILPLRRGVAGIAVSYCGFKAVYCYRNKKDIFGRRLSSPQINIADALAAAAVLEMGEARERRPLCIIEKISKIEFQNKAPNQRELKSLLINMQRDVFAPVLRKAGWKKGRGGIVL